MNPPTHLEEIRDQPAVAIVEGTRPRDGASRLRLRDFAEPLTGDGSLSAAQQLVPLVGEIAVLVAYVLNTIGDAHGTGRHNLVVLRNMAARLAETAEAALRDEPQE